MLGSRNEGENRSVHGERRPVELGARRRVSPVRFGRGEMVWELREGEAVLARGSERAEERR